MKRSDIVSRVQAMCDDPDGTYIDGTYVAGHIQQQYDILYNRLYLNDSQFDEQIIVLPSVPAGTRDLSAYMAEGKELAMLVTPRQIEWKLPGLDDTNYRLADGPLDAVRDVVDGMPSLDSWTWSRLNILLSKFGTDLDLRITGRFMFAPLTAPDATIQMERNVSCVLAYMTAKAIGQARGNPTWIKEYRQEADDAFDDLFIAKVKQEQGMTRRVARISRHRYVRTPSPAIDSSNTATGTTPVPTFVTALTDTVLSPAFQYQIVQATGGAGGIMVSLPLAAQAKSHTITVQRVDAGAGLVTIAAQGADLINGNATYILVAQYQFVTLVSDGTNWNITGNN